MLMVISGLRATNRTGFIGSIVTVSSMLIQAEAGVMSLTGSSEQPSRAGVSLSDVGTGIYSAVLVLAALIDRMEGLLCLPSLQVPHCDV